MFRYHRRLTAPHTQLMEFIMPPVIKTFDKFISIHIAIILVKCGNNGIFGHNIGIYNEIWIATQTWFLKQCLCV